MDKKDGMSKTVTVVIPIYNVEKYLNRCIESVAGQTYKNLEIILVDDESPDNCPRICEDWKNRDNRIKVIHKKNGGLGYARNTGIDCATGEYNTVFFLLYGYRTNCSRWFSNTLYMGL